MNAPVVCTQSVLDVVLPAFHVPDLDLSVCVVSQTVGVQSTLDVVIPVLCVRTPDDKHKICGLQSSVATVTQSCSVSRQTLSLTC